MFLDSIRERQEEEERQRKERDGEEVKNFKEYAKPRLSDLEIDRVTSATGQSQHARVR